MRINVTIPVFNEERLLQASLQKLHAFLASQTDQTYEIHVADNGSTDRSLDIAREFARKHPAVTLSHLPTPGRGGALKSAWLQSDADILSYMDADLSSDLRAFPTLIHSIISGAYDLGTGSRLLKPDDTTRCLKRELTSRCYQALIGLLFRRSFSDAQCGFKAISRACARHLLPLVSDTGWFFDTELLILAEHYGYRAFDLPVPWIERKESHVRLFHTAIEDLKGLIKLKRRMATSVPKAPTPSIRRMRGRS